MEGGRGRQRERERDALHVISFQIGVVHADEVAYVFGMPFTNDPPRTGSIVSNWTHDDRRVSQQMMTLWTNFAKYG